MIVHFVGAGPGDPELLTRKAERLLRECRICIYAGSLVSPAVLALIPEGAERHDSAEMSHEEVVAVYREAKRHGIDVVRLHSGDPSIYGAIREQMNALDRLGIDYDVCPGVSSFQAAAAALRAELTAPEVAQTVVLTRTEGRTPLPADQDLERIARTRATLCLFLSIGKLREIAETLAAHYGADCPVAVVHRASWPDEKVIRGTLTDIADKAEPERIRATALIVVGRALARDIPASKLYDAGFSHGFRKGRKQEETP
jgi:precorrin-4/cobalt-precorrin-4 C11-methyltransferase